MLRHHAGWLLLSFLLVPLSLRGDDWPQWRGPDRSGVSKETGLLKAWPKGGPKLAWTFKNAGNGVSSFAVVKGVVYTLGSRGEDTILLALDAKNGQELWTAKIGPLANFFQGNSWGIGPRSTPTVDGNFLYALGEHGDLVCVDISQKGKAVWRINLAKDLGGEMMTEWGYSESPLVDGDRLICTPGGDKGTLAALDKTTGKEVWRSTKWTDKAPYSSIVAADIHGVRQYIQTGYISETKGGVIAGVEAKTGALLWKESLFKKSSYAIAPTPIVKGDLVYITSGYSGGCHLFKISKEQKATEQYTSKETRKEVSNTHGGVVLLGDYLYGHSERDRWICQELLKGSLAWDNENVLSCRSGAITAADGMLYLFSDEGEVGLAPADPKALNLTGSFTLPERSKIPGKGASKDSKPWAHPVVANGLLFVRDHDLIFAYEVRK